MTSHKKAIRKGSFASVIGEDAFFNLIEKGTVVKAVESDVLFHEGGTADHIYIILEGQVRLCKTSSEGKLFFFQKKNQYDLLGELSLFNGLNYHFTAEAIENTELIRFERQELEKLFAESKTFSTGFMKWVGNQNQMMMAQFRDLVFCGKQGAVFSILVRLSNEYGQKVDSGVLINQKITNQELANYVGATRESINRILKRLINDGILSVNTKYITIHQLDYLKEHLRCDCCPYEACTI
ncbi:Crp/Fnr family transcriptional regulator [Salisediminibacterium selenitireducens]|uniref:Transcriptional regulator, Crp/Fnr family n=1 Tax=Bacillus selenitireducens (strain ATCC 700615 / DSM 15326 / MLS10) TaxID=439292 RepID=D6XT68_BACIE|nr:Crp/Fnr family transcriptional regulator [Salisediminibacterium selenitireducens]ADH99004.1 transcriptional regulator, Crp/Fnr family [[Bacillus] selenitireducens MLS10]